MSPSSALDRPVPLAELVEAAALEEVLSSCADLCGVGLRVLDPSGRVLGDPPSYLELCEVVRERPLGLGRCEQKLHEVHSLRQAPDEPPPRCDCFTGLRYQAMALTYEGTVLGTVVYGPYLPLDRPLALPGFVQSLLGPSLAEGEDALPRLPRATDAHARKVLEHVVRVLGVVVHSAYARWVTAQLHVATLAHTTEELTDKNRRLAAAVERLQEVDRLKSNFLATVSHELRTPLTSVIGYSEMLLEGLAGALSGDQKEYVQVIMEKGDQLLQLITGILDVSRIESGTLRLARDPVDLNEVIVGVLGAMAPLARRKRLALEAKTPQGAPRVRGDKLKLRQVLLSLVGNAIKFTAEGGRIEVTVGVGGMTREDDAVSSSAPKRMGVRMRVVDNGIGIPPEKQAHIFEPFFQVDSSSTREYGGTGLGLTLAKSYVEAHGGRIWVESEPNRGSTFTLTLPAVEEDLAEYLRGRAAG
ncbi:MAG TPA: ATP-binding protein [Haliangiales bacterium]|nr:ATP-binding protein [Haliangiales bacterium]